jgi:hypothetical protein
LGERNVEFFKQLELAAALQPPMHAPCWPC